MRQYMIALGNILTLSVPDEGYSLSVPDEGYSELFDSFVSER
jgi:hypothetical protein